MEKATDPVCGMEVYPAPQLRSTFESHEYYFCSEECRQKFDTKPEKYIDTEKHEPPYTISGKVAAPRFGSAGSGGLENEPMPERHGRQ
jgi:YHS domain-containing protein